MAPIGFTCNGRALVVVRARVRVVAGAVLEPGWRVPVNGAPARVAPAVPMACGPGIDPDLAAEKNRRCAIEISGFRRAYIRRRGIRRAVVAVGVRHGNRAARQQQCDGKDATPHQ